MAFTTLGLSRRRLNSLAHRVSKDVIGKTLAHAFVIAVKREGLSLHVAQIDDTKNPATDSDPSRINVSVSGSIVQKSWVG